MTTPPPKVSIEYGLSLGSNEGHRMQYLRDARAALEAVPRIEIAASAPVYETEPVDVKPEYMDRFYLNTVLLVISDMVPAEMRELCHSIEVRFGRTRTADRNSPRPLDVDIIYAGQTMISGDGLIIPHPRWAQRRFVVQPLADVRPGLFLPGTRDTVRAVLEKLPAKPGVVLYRETW